MKKIYKMNNKIIKRKIMNFKKKKLIKIKFKQISKRIKKFNLRKIKIIYKNFQIFK